MSIGVAPASVHRFAEVVWVASAPHAMFGLQLGTRMTVVRLPGGGLWIHSPIQISPALKAEIDALGAVKHIVCPNDFHHVFAAGAAALYPDAVLHGSPTLQRKRKDLRFGAELSGQPHPGWEGAFDACLIRGSLLRETVFFHRASRTLITSDLVQNFKTSPHLPTRWYLKLMGVHGKVGLSRAVRPVYRDRKAARESIEHILAWPFERVIIAHGDNITEDAREQIRRGLAWL